MKNEQATVPLFGARNMARNLLTEVSAKNQEIETLKGQLTKLGAFSLAELEEKRNNLERENDTVSKLLITTKTQLEEALKEIVVTEELNQLQEIGIYKYRHPLTDAVSYQKELTIIQNDIKTMAKKEGGAILAATGWTVNNSETQGRKMINETSKLLLRVFNTEADNLIWDLKPHGLDKAIQKLTKTAEIIERNGKTLHISISPLYLKLRIQELELTSDFIQKKAKEKEIEREEKERLKEERKAQEEMERERERLEEKLEKEKQHYNTILPTLIANGDKEGEAKAREELDEIQKGIENIDYRLANIRAGYVYVISNIGSFGEGVIKVGLTRRLDPQDRIDELGNASVPFKFDVHAMFFSKDAVGIETAMHQRLANKRINLVNNRKEFFRATPQEAKVFLSELAGSLLEFHEIPKATQYRESLSLTKGK